MCIRDSVILRDGVDDMAQNALREAGITCFRRFDKEDLDRVAEQTILEHSHVNWEPHLLEDLGHLADHVPFPIIIFICHVITS